MKAFFDYGKDELKQKKIGLKLDTVLGCYTNT